MCLKFAMTSKLIKSGIFYKIMRRNGENFAPLFSGFYKSGIGGTFISGTNTIKINITYKFGRTYRVKHNRVATADCSQHKYRAGVHGWKKLSKALTEMKYFKDMNYLDYSLALIECKYSNAVAEDDDTIVALSVTPLREII